MGISISITDDRIKKIDSFVEADIYRDRSAFITQSVDLMIKTLESKRTIDFMYFIGMPLFFFLVCVGLTLYLASLFFYLLTGISGIYLVLFVFVFHNKYRGVKYGNNSK